MKQKNESQPCEDIFNDSRGVLAENLRALRKRRNLSQERLALEANIDRTIVSKIERELANPSLRVLSKICATLEVPVARLFQ